MHYVSCITTDERERAIPTLYYRVHVCCFPCIAMLLGSPARHSLQQCSLSAATSWLHCMLASKRARSRGRDDVNDQERVRAKR